MQSEYYKCYYIQKSFWEQCKKSYRSTKMSRKKWLNTKAEEPVVGDIILLKSNGHPDTYPTASIIHCVTSDDEIVRRFRLRTTEGTEITRRITNVIPMITSKFVAESYCQDNNFETVSSGT
jgi:Family of unknown function (DUF5641)